MQVTAVLAGEVRPASVSMCPDWTLLCRLGTEERELKLVLQALLPCSGHLLYLFAPDVEVPGLSAASPLPPLASELLIYSPLVPLLRHPEGFEVMSRRAWEDMTAARLPQDSVMQVSAGDSLMISCEEETELDELEAASDLPDDVDDEDNSDAPAQDDEEEDFEDTDEDRASGEEPLP